MMGIELISPGLLTTIQDTGRQGYRQYGIPPGGALDPFALRAANMLIGNGESSAAFEMIYKGAEYLFHEDCLIAVCGGDFGVVSAGVPVPMWRPVLMEKGARLSFGSVRRGSTVYLAVAGGLQVPEVLESRSTYLPAEIGGFSGRPLKTGDRIPVGPPSSLAATWMKSLQNDDSRRIKSAKWFLSTAFMPNYREHPVIHVTRGPEFEGLPLESQERFFSESFTVSTKSNRMGFRLTGMPLDASGLKEMVTTVVLPGTVQLPPDGNPVVLMADAQTTGGYPRIAQVIAIDLPVMAQTLPKAKVRFHEVSRIEAQALYLIRELGIRELQALLPYR